jgi:hypothetical protein
MGHEARSNTVPIFSYSFMSFHDFLHGQHGEPCERELLLVARQEPDIRRQRSLVKKKNETVDNFPKEVVR